MKTKIWNNTTKMGSSANSLIESLDNPFWQFSIKVYECEEVKARCLSLQNNTGVNVNLLLFCCWLSSAAETIPHGEFTKICSSVQDWHSNVTKSLRRTRQHLKKMPPNTWTTDFYQQLLADEIASEAYQQKILFSFFEHRREFSAGKNEESTLGYLHWLFEDMKIIIDENLKSELRDFAKLTLSYGN